MKNKIYYMVKETLLIEVPRYEITEIYPKKTKYCICIPIINEGDRIKNQLSKMKNLNNVADIIIADGGSTDGSNDINFLKSLDIRTLLIKLGPGKLSAQLRMAYHYAVIKEGYEGVITIDGNDKDGVEAIPEFIDKLEEGYDFVQGSRFLPGGQAINTPMSRLLPIKLIHIPMISYMAGFKYTDTTNGFRAYSKKLLLDERIQIFRDIFDTYELLAYLSVKAPRIGYKVIDIPVTRRYPKSSKIPTKISPIKGNFKILKILINLMLNRYDMKITRI
jgi:dolichol-phosphate mannosyltransferase